MNIFRKSVKFCLALHLFLISSCSSIESTLDSTWDSISEAGDYIYDSVNFWEESEPEQSEAIIIEEAVEVPDYAMPDQTKQSFPVQPSFSPQPLVQPYYDPIYRSARQYYFVGPNGTPMLAPQPPPFPQYSIDQVSPVLPYSYNNNLNFFPPAMATPNNPNLKLAPQKQIPRMLTEEEEMELFGIQNNCIQVAKDLVNGGYVCDDFD
ncbi:MAG: hypothetical protein CMP38_07285 [Rickettsiales bacterium]|nr:hypothetical protein [Rickettsiales bacterium]|tara:strand:- start:3067 stop:3687 length:621 start_codon:yes stop_codon:yes gene_type:complete